MTNLKGDSLTPREVAARILEEQRVVIPTKTTQFTLYDDGTNGDSTANDRYWEVSLPPDFDALDGDYHFHAFFRLCKSDGCGGGSCIEREAQQSITVRTQMSQNSNVTVERLESIGGRLRSRILITPVDWKGTLLGPGIVDELVLTPNSTVQIEQRSDLDGRGTYQILVNWVRDENRAPGLTIAQYGRPANAIRVSF